MLAEPFVNFAASLGSVIWVAYYRGPFKCNTMEGGGYTDQHEGAWSNFISVTRGWVGAKFAGKKCYVTRMYAYVNGPTSAMTTILYKSILFCFPKHWWCLLCYVTH